jgi:hypothetical protein
MLHGRLHDEEGVRRRFFESERRRNACRAQGPLHRALVAEGGDTIGVRAGVADAETVEHQRGQVEIGRAFGHFLDEVEDDVGLDAQYGGLGARTVVCVLGFDHLMAEPAQDGADLVGLDEGVLLVEAHGLGARRNEDCDAHQLACSHQGGTP